MRARDRDSRRDPARAGASRSWYGSALPAMAAPAAARDRDSDSRILRLGPSRDWQPGPGPGARGPGGHGRVARPRPAARSNVSGHRVATEGRRTRGSPCSSRCCLAALQRGHRHRLHRRYCSPNSCYLLSLSGAAQGVAPSRPGGARAMPRLSRLRAPTRFRQRRPPRRLTGSRNHGTNGQLGYCQSGPSHESDGPPAGSQARSS